MPNKPFESRIQDLVYNVDVGIGLRLIKFGLYILFLMVVMVVYTATEFRGLKEAESMEFAQLGRNVMFRHKLATQCVRPAGMWNLIEHVASPNPRLNHNPQIMDHPDALHPPLYPFALAVGFKLFRHSIFPTGEAGQTVIEQGRIWLPEQWVIMPFGHLCTVATGLLLYLLSRRLFDARVALLGVTLFFLSDAVWRMSISGLPIPLAMLLTTFAIYAAVVAMARRDEGRAPVTWVVLLLASSVSLGLAFLTRYGTAVLVPALALFIGVSCRGRGWRWGSLYLLVFLAVIAPWIWRNITVTGAPLGLAPYTALNGDDPILDNTFDRALAPALEFGTVSHNLLVKFLSGIARLYAENLRTLGDGLIVCLFLATFFYSFAREQVRRFRWCFLLALVGMLVLGALFGKATARLLHVFLPVVIMYGLAFFFILLDRLQLRLPIMRMAVTGAMVVLSSVPLLLTLLPPRAAPPYPPYYAPYIAHVCNMLTEDELLTTDMPWATAWYGNRHSLLLPATIDDFYEINDYTHRIAGIYFTTITRDREFVKTLQTGAYRTWFPLLEQPPRIPGDFPLQQGFPLNNLDQVFLTDRARWK